MKTPRVFLIKPSNYWWEVRTGDVPPAPAISRAVIEVPGGSYANVPKIDPATGLRVTNYEWVPTRNQVKHVLAQRRVVGGRRMAVIANEDLVYTARRAAYLNSLWEPVAYSEVGSIIEVPKSATSLFLNEEKFNAHFKAALRY